MHREPRSSPISTGLLMFLYHLVAAIGSENRHSRLPSPTHTGLQASLELLHDPAARWMPAIPAFSQDSVGLAAAPPPTSQAASFPLGLSKLHLIPMSPLPRDGRRRRGSY